MTIQLTEDALERSFTCVTCGDTAVPDFFWRRLSADAKAAAKNLGYRQARTKNQCRRCFTAGRAVDPPSLRNLPKGYTDEHGEYVPACASEPDTWFPEPGAETTARRAKAVCATCPLREACLDLAMEAEGGSNGTWRHGVYGGLTPGDRYALAREEGRKGRSRAYTTLFCVRGHRKAAYYNAREGLCSACVSVSRGEQVRTLAERADLAAMRELHAETSRVYHSGMKGKYKPQAGTGGFMEQRKGQRHAQDAN